MANKTRRTVTLSPELDRWLGDQPNASGTVEKAIARARDEQQARLRCEISPMLAEAIDNYAERRGVSRSVAVCSLLAAGLHSYDPL